VNSSWITDLISEHQDVETPDSWIFWSLVSAVSAVAANAYTLRTLKGNLLYYPNLYIILMGESGLGKGFPINLSKRLVQKAECTRVIAGRSSIQAIIQELSSFRQVQGKPIIADSRGHIINGELSTALIKDPMALNCLTDLFDRNFNPEWVNLLKGDGAEKLKEPYVTCLFGTSPAHFYDSVPQANIEGGYIGRNLVIYEEKRSKDLDLLDSEEESIDDDKFNNYIIPKYIPHLQRISKNKARMVPDTNARIHYNTWRREWRATQAKYNDRTGFVNRVPDHTLKLAMCLALARYENNTIINEADVTEAIEKVTGLIYASNKASEGGGLDPQAAQTKKVVDFLINAPENQLTRTELLVRGYGNYDSLTLDKILDTLMDMKWIIRQKVGVGKNMDWNIMLSGQPKENLDEFRRKAKKSE